MTELLNGPLLAGHATDEGPPGETQLVMEFMTAKGIEFSTLIDEVLGRIDTLGGQGFFFASDERLITNLDGVVLYYDTAKTEGMPIFMTNLKFYGKFVLLAIVAGEVTCFLSDEQLDMASDWLGRKQVVWYEDFHSTSGKPEDEKGDKSGPKLH